MDVMQGVVQTNLSAFPQHLTLWAEFAVVTESWPRAHGYFLSKEVQKTR